MLQKLLLVLASISVGGVLHAADATTHTPEELATSFSAIAAVDHRSVGIRAALGARPGNLVRLVLRGSLVKVGLGVALGLPGPVVYHLSRPWANVAPLAVLAKAEAWAVIGATVLLIVPASWLAARDAAHADPATSMRAE
jgi:hypothetical protein